MEKLAKLIRYYIIISTTAAGSGHPTSSLSATDLMTVLMFGGYFRADLEDTANPNNDRLIFSKGHAAPLLYSLYAAAGNPADSADKVSEKELMSLRQFGSPLEGHPTMEFKYTEAPTGSLGQGLSIGLGMALNAKYIDKLTYRTYVLLGDSEMSEGSNWEAMQLASFYKLDNLIAIVDVNRLGQRGETMYGYDINNYVKKAEAFGWRAIFIDGHNLSAIDKAYQEAEQAKDAPIMIIAKTIKGKGISFLEDKDGWHGKTLSEEMAEKAIAELGEIDKEMRGQVSKPPESPITNLQSPRLFGGQAKNNQSPITKLNYTLGSLVATRKAYGNALGRLADKYPRLVVLDAEVSNSTYSEIFKNKCPERFFEMFIAEQNMVGVALGLSRRGKIPFVSTFAAFMTRAFDQIRMSQYADSNIKFVGSHAGVSIGEDGASQMGLEEIAMFRTLLGSIVLYPSDAVSAEKLIEAAVLHKGNVYIQTTRSETPIIYDNSEEFTIGGSKVVRQSDKDKVTVVGAGITLRQALLAYEKLKEEKINIRVIDLYSIKPIDKKTLQKAASETKAIIIVEDQFPEGGIGEAVMSALAQNETLVYSLAARRIPKSGKPDELLDYEEISASAIVKKVKEII